MWLKKYKEEGRKFDVIINDLTAIPVTKNIVGEYLLPKLYCEKVLTWEGIKLQKKYKK